MYIPSKHMSEKVEDVMQEEGKKALKEPHHPPPCGPTIKIVINTGPSAMPPPFRSMGHKSKSHKPMSHKPKKRKANKSVAGPMEKALGSAY